MLIQGFQWRECSFLLVCGFFQPVKLQRSCDQYSWTAEGWPTGENYLPAENNLCYAKRSRLSRLRPKEGYSIVNILKHSMVPHLFVYPCCHGNSLLFTGCSDKETVIKPCYCFRQNQAQSKSNPSCGPSICTRDRQIINVVIMKNIIKMKTI